MRSKLLLAACTILAVGFSAFTPGQTSIGVNYKLPSTGDVLYPTIAEPCVPSGSFQCTAPIPELNDEVYPLFHNDGTPYLRD